MLVSIVIPIYNVEKYLNACLESVLKLQSDWEAVLVDDGSTDNSGLLCDQWAGRDGRIHVIHQKNGGLSAARNTGIRNARGDYVMFLDSDDFLNPEETDKMLAQLEKAPEVLMGLYRQYYTDTNEYRKESCGGFLSVSGYIPVEQFLKTVPADGRECYMVAWRFVVNREVLQEHELLFLPGILHEDEEWTSRLLCSVRMIYVTHSYFYQYRQSRAGAITSQVRPKNIWDRFIIMERMNRTWESLEMESAGALYLQNRMAQLYLSNMLDSRVLSKEEWDQANEQFSKFSFCIASMCGTIGGVVRIFIKLIGIKRTCELLKLVYWAYGHMKK